MEGKSNSLKQPALTPRTPRIQTACDEERYRCEQEQSSRFRRYQLKLDLINCSVAPLYAKNVLNCSISGQARNRLPEISWLRQKLNHIWKSYRWSRAGVRRKKVELS